MDLAAFILAGGRSSRMGRDKAFLDWRDQTLLTRALELARAVTREVSIVGQRQKFGAFAPVVEDVYPGQGPLGGIHAALVSSESELNLVLAVDTPLLTPEFLAYLVAQAALPVPHAYPLGTPGALCPPVVTAPRVYGKTQPLCAVYRRAFAEVAAASLHSGRNKIEPLFASVPQRIIEEPELSKLAFDPRMFDNLNTPGEWEKARSC